ncbi:MAG: Re/Si-specific NAD(P)(+) transhydrogenase subunit alpha [Planctomycetota bacterium]|jgi:NAD(P) transhydrogenase subunit alpha
MIVGVVKESFPGERRVALTPRILSALVKKDLEVIIEAGAGDPAGFRDAEFQEKGARIVASRGDVFGSADILCQVRALGANPEAGRADLELMRSGQVIIGHAEPLTDAAPAQAIAERGAVLFGMELMPRITRAQTMDVLSSQATIAGYKAVLMAAEHLPRMFAMMMTAAGTVAAAHVFVIGAGVAGLQAIATARRLGGVVKAYDIRPAVKEEVQSLGAKFVELELEASEAQDKGGYAKAMDEEFYRKQRELMAETLTETHAVITTAAVPGKKAPVLVTEEMVKGMPSSSVIVDLAAERGGNCELTRADETVEAHGVTILGPTNLPSTVPYHASQMYAKNVQTFIFELLKEGELNYDMENEVIKETMVTRDGQVVHDRVREMLGASTPVTAAVSAEGSTE